MTDVEPVVPSAGPLVLAATGEVFDPADVDDVLRALARCRELEAQLSEAKRHVTGLLVQYSVDRGERTVTTPKGHRFVREGSARKQFDAAAIREELLAAGMPEDRVREIVETRITMQVNGVEAAKAARSNDTYREILDRHTRTSEPSYSIRVQ